MKKAFPLKRLNFIFLALVAFLCVLLLTALIHFAYRFQRYIEISNQYAVISKSALNIQEGSDYLTEQARLFIITTDFKHLENYFYENNVNMRREKAVDEIVSYNDTVHGLDRSVEHLKQALYESQELKQLEYYAMRLVVEGKHFDKDPSLTIPKEISTVVLYDEDAKLSDEYKISKAWLVLFSQDYIFKKNMILSHKTQAVSEIFDYSEKIHEQSLDSLTSVFFRMILNIFAIFLMTVFLFVGVINLVIKPLSSHIQNIKSNKKLMPTHTKEFNILVDTYNEMFDKNEANEILLRHKAEHDELTGLINRAALNQIKKALSYTEENIALILIDVDFFKLINDNYGHSTGDKVLKLVADVLLESFRSMDYVGRIGGDEFTVIMTQCDKDMNKNKELISKKMEYIKERLFTSRDGLPSVTLSCGIALSTKGYEEVLYEQADMALYDVKRAGRNDYAFYESSTEFKI